MLSSAQLLPVFSLPITFSISKDAIGASSSSKTAVSVSVSSAGSPSNDRSSEAGALIFLKCSKNCSGEISASKCFDFFLEKCL